MAENNQPVASKAPEAMRYDNVDPYWHPDNKEGHGDGLEKEKRNRNIAIVALGIALVVIIVCVILLVIAYVNLRQARSCNCPSTQSYYVTGYDPQINWNSNLRNTKSSSFKSTATSESTKIKDKIKAVYNIYQVEVTQFGNPAGKSGKSVEGILFYATITLQGNTLPTIDDLKKTFGSDSVEMSEFSLFKTILATSTKWGILQLNTRATALCATPYFPNNFSPLPMPTPSGKPVPTTPVAPPSTSAASNNPSSQPSSVSPSTGSTNTGSTMNPASSGTTPPHPPQTGTTGSASSPPSSPASVTGTQMGSSTISVSTGSSISMASTAPPTQPQTTAPPMTTTQGTMASSSSISSIGSSLPTTASTVAPSGTTQGPISSTSSAPSSPTSAPTNAPTSSTISTVTPTTAGSSNAPTTTTPSLPCNSSTAALDIGLLLDSSQFITSTIFNALKNYLANIYIPSITISQNKSHVQLGTVTATPYIVLDLTYNERVIKRNLQDLQDPNEPFLNIGTGLKSNWERWMKADRQQLPNIVFFFASHNSTETDTSAKQWAKNYRQLGLYLVFVGVGPNPPEAYLKTLAYKPSWYINMANTNTFSGLAKEMGSFMCAASNLNATLS